MHAKVGPTCAPGRLVSARPAGKRSMSLGVVYRLASFAHKVWEISAGAELHEAALAIPQISL